MTDPSKLFKIDKFKYFDLIGYQPHPKQELFHKSKARFKVPVCGRRFGKTAMGARELEPLLMSPNRRLWIVGPTYDLGEKEFRVIWNDVILKLGFGKQKEVKRSYAKKQGDLSIEMPWGTRLEVRSADRPENLVGEGLDQVIMAEAAKHTRDTWDRFIRPALTDRRGSATFSTTPEGQNWIYQLWKQGRDPSEPDFESWQFPSWENPYIYPGGREDPEILLAQRTTPDEIFKQEYAADFTSFSGRIYSEFAEDTHVQQVAFNPLLPNYIAFDWGFVDAMAAIEFQVDSFQRIRIWREHYRTRLRLRDFLAELKVRDQPDGYHINLCFGDAADPEAIITTSEDFSACIGDPMAKANWREGIELVQGFIKPQENGTTDEYGAPNYDPWLIVDHSCANLIREFNNYRAMEPPKGTTERNAREAAIDYDNHGLDALRYGLMHIFRLGATQTLSDVMIVNDDFKTDIQDGGFFTSGGSFFTTDISFS